ncbi:Beta-arabinofuranosyltransferase RAY1 [Linum perenne]
MKQSRASLWWIWLYGSFLIVISLYATRKLPPSVQEVINRRPASSIGPTHQPDPTITIFSAITHYPIGQRQRLAVRSWLGLSNQITVVLFTQEHHPSVVAFASGFGSRVSVDSAVDFMFLGTPFFHSMVERSKAFQTDVTVFVHSQAVLFPDLVHTLNFAHKLDNFWLLVASLEETNFFTENGEKLQLNELQEMIHGWNRSNRCEDRSMIMAWNGGNMPLHNGVLPPFLFGRGIHNHWLINEAIASEFRLVFDASSTISGAFLKEPDMAENRSWEAIGNSLLGSSYGSLLFHEANYSTTVLAKLDDQYLFLEDAKLGKGMSSCSVKNELRNLQQPLEFRAPIESLLSLAADETRTVVLAVAGYSYKDMLMSWVCRLRRLKVTNFVICALDHETFEFSVLQGLPVFYDPSAPRNISFDDCHFGTKCFQRVTKVKSRLVLKILKLGTAIEKVVIHAATSGLSEQPSFYDVLCGEGGSNRVGDNRCLDPSLCEDGLLCSTQ